ncbi:MAG: GNAT family N-acetyltransferase [Candidatus Paceibacterota bacterium]
MLDQPNPLPNPTKLNYIIQWGSKRDLLDSCKLERELLGEETYWEDERVLHWYHRLALLAKRIRDEDDNLIAYISALSISPKAYASIQTSKIHPWNLTYQDIDPLSKHYWIGGALVRPEHQRKGIMTQLYNELNKAIGDNIIADAYSDKAERFMEKNNWTLLTTKDTPLYLHPKGKNYLSSPIPN